MSEKTDRQKVKEIAREYFQKNIDNVSTGKEGFPDTSSFIYGFVDGYILARKEIIQEIERRLKNIPNFHGSSFDDQDMGSEAALESLLSWITQENNLDGVADD